MMRHQDQAGPPGCGSQLAWHEAGGVGCQNRVRRTKPVEFAEDLLLHGQTLDRTFYDHVAARDHRIQLGAAADSVPGRLDAIMRYQPGCRHHSKTGLDSVETCLNSFLCDVVETNIASCKGKLHGDAMPHQSRTDDRNSLDFVHLHGFSF